MKDVEHCPCCSNHCLKGNCKCNRGAMYFARLELNVKKQEFKKLEIKNQDEQLEHIVHLLRKLSHKIEKHSRDISLVQIFSALNNDEVLQLELMLQKLRQQFANDKRK